MHMLQIKRDRDYEGYMPDNRALGNCFTIYDEKSYYHYEFEINDKEAKVKYDSILYIKEAIKEFRKYNQQVSSFYNENRTFYQGFDPIFTFKLPIDILQPTEFFIDEQKLDTIEKYLGNETLYVPVCIIDDEYVLLDGHARVRYLQDNYVKMVDVYLAEPKEYTQDVIYIAKENNLFKIKQMEILPHEEYLKYLEQSFGVED